MGADLMRWLYCRQNPAANINFGPAPPRRCVASSFSSCGTPTPSSATTPGSTSFDPAAPQVPVKDRPDIDRWILSDLQQLIRTAHKAFQSFNVQAFCLEAEKFRR